MLGDNWDKIRNVLLRHEWIDSRTLREETGMPIEIICKVIRTQVKNGVVEREFIQKGTYRSSIGLIRKHGFVWRLKK